MYEDIQYEVDDRIATLTLDRADVYNAFTVTTLEELNDALRRAQEDNQVLALILTGAGDGFCSGADVNEMPNWGDMQMESYAGFLWSVQHVVRQLRTGATPTIAAVNGPAIGAGCDFALACDFRIVSPEAPLREGFVRIGLIPGDGGAWLLPRLIGESKAKEYLLTGRDITPEEAVDLGLAIEKSAEPLESAFEIATTLRDLPRIAVQYTKQLIDPGLTFEDYCTQAIRYQWQCVNDPEHKEAVTAFQEGREPSYDRS